jgi:hypothetical protein
VDGAPTNNVPIFVNAPYRLVSGGLTPHESIVACQLDMGQPGSGWVETIQYVVSDLFDYALSKIDLNETLENFQGAWSSSPPTAGSWAAGSGWDDDYHFTDWFAACSLPGGLNPQPQVYGQSGQTVLLSDTQKFWIGSITHFKGYCVQIDAAPFYIDHAQFSQLITPVPSQAQCNQGTTIN